MEKVRFGVIGIGNMGTSHSGWLVGNRIEGAELTAVCDIDEKRREWAKENLPGTVTVYFFFFCSCPKMSDSVITANLINGYSKPFFAWP